MEAGSGRTRRVEGIYFLVRSRIVRSRMAAHGVLKNPGHYTSKLTNQVTSDRMFYIQLDQAKAILKVGLQSKDKSTRANADRARENLLRAGRFELLEIE